MNRSRIILVSSKFRHSKGAFAGQMLNSLQLFIPLQAPYFPITREFR